MRFFPFLMSGWFFVACANPKEKIVEEQKATKKQIDDVQFRLKTIEVVLGGYSIGVNDTKYDTLLRPLTIPELKERGKLIDDNYKRIQDSISQWVSVVDSLNLELKIHRARYDSLEMELKKY